MSKGKYYWGLKVDVVDVSDDGEIFAYADEVSVLADGSLSLITNDQPVLIVASGSWSCVFAASVFDGQPIAAERWINRVNEETL